MISVGPLEVRAHCCRIHCRSGRNYCGATMLTDCVWPNLGGNKDNTYSRDKRGAFGSAGPTAAAYVAVA